MAPPQPARRFFFVLLAAAAVLFAVVVRPIASALFLAAVLAGVAWPAHRWLTRRLGNRPKLSSGLFVVAVSLLLLVPVAAFATFAIKQGLEGVRYVIETVRGQGARALLDHLPPSLQELVGKGLASLTEEQGQSLVESLQERLTSHGGKAAAAVGATLSATGSLAFQAAMMLIAFYFFLVDGERLVKWIDGMSPLEPGQTGELLVEFKKVSYSVLLSTVITSAVQAVVALGGYLLGRVPHPVFFAGVTFFFAFVPAVGAGAVCLAAAGLLLATGHPWAALFLAVWGVAVVGLVDNAVKPLLMKGGMQMNGAVVFFALIGGLTAFGGIGLLLGPLVVTMLLSLLRMYQRDFRPERVTDGGRRA